MTKLCAVDADCPSTLVCLANTTWFLASNRSLTGDGCGVSMWYGWGGPNGTDINTPAVRWWMGSAMAIMIGSLVAFGFAVRILYVLTIRLRRRGDPKIITISQVAFGTIMLFAMQTTIFIREFFPEHAVTADYAGSNTEKSSTDDQYMYIFFALALASTLQALISVAVVWILVANASQRLRSTAASEMDMRRVQNGGIAFEFAVALAFVVILALKRFSLLAIPAALTAVVVLASYATGLVKMRRLLLAAMGSSSSAAAAPGTGVVAPTEQSNNNGSTSNKDKEKGSHPHTTDAERRKKFAAVLRDITFHTALLLGLGVSLAITYIVVMIREFVQPWPEYCRDESAPCYTIVNWNFVAVFLLLINSTIIHYVRASVWTMKRAQDSRDKGTSSHNQNTHNNNNNNDALPASDTFRSARGMVVSSPDASTLSVGAGGGADV